MTAATVRALRDGAGASPAAGTPMAGDLEVPRPLRLILTAGWNLAESAGLPVAAYAVAAWAGGRNAGLIAGPVAIWLMAVIRKIVTGSVPSLLKISALVLTVQAAMVLATGELWLFLLQFPLANLCMCVLFARTASGPDPLVARLAAEVVALRQPPDRHPGLHRFFQRATWLWAGIFLLLAAALAVLMVTEQARIFLMLSTAVTVALVLAGTGASALWFLWVLRRLGLRLCFAQPQPGRRAGSPLDTSVPASVRQPAIPSAPASSSMDRTPGADEMTVIDNDLTKRDRKRLQAAGDRNSISPSGTWARSGASTCGPWDRDWLPVRPATAFMACGCTG